MTSQWPSRGSGSSLPAAAPVRRGATHKPESPSTSPPRRHHRSRRRRPFETLSTAWVKGLAARSRRRSRRSRRAGCASLPRTPAATLAFELERFLVRALDQPALHASRGRPTSVKKQRANRPSSARSRQVTGPLWQGGDVGISSIHQACDHLRRTRADIGCLRRGQSLYRVRRIGFNNSGTRNCATQIPAAFPRGLRPPSLARRGALSFVQHEDPAHASTGPATLHPHSPRTPSQIRTTTTVTRSSRSPRPFRRNRIARINVKTPPGRTIDQFAARRSCEHVRCGRLECGSSQGDESFPPNRFTTPRRPASLSANLKAPPFCFRPLRHRS